jgi:FtsH-binding integral membrane protein
MNDEIISVVYLILILVLILPGFIYANKNRKTFFNNFFIWAIIIGIIVILIKFFTN